MTFTCMIADTGVLLYSYVRDFEGCPVLVVLGDLKKIEEEVKVRARELCGRCHEYSSNQCACPD